MSPSVEAINPSDDIIGPNGFVVDLSNPINFDPELFDEQVAQIYKPWVEGEWRLKFAIKNDQMYIFGTDQRFDRFQDRVGELQSAGMIIIRDFGEGEIERYLLGISDSNVGQDQFVIPESQKYIREIVEPKLKDYFKEIDAF